MRVSKWRYIDISTLSIEPRDSGTFGKNLAKKARDEDQPVKDFQISKNPKFD